MLIHLSCCKPKGLVQLCVEAGRCEFSKDSVLIEFLEPGKADHDKKNTNQSNNKIYSRAHGLPPFLIAKKTLPQWLSSANFLEPLSLLCSV